AFGHAGNIGAGNVTFEVEMRSELVDELLVAIRGAASQLVVEVQHVQHDAEAFAQRMKQAKQSDRIGSARHSNTEAVAGSSERFFLQRSHEVSKKRRLHAGIVPAGDATEAES